MTSNCLSVRRICFKSGCDLERMCILVGTHVGKLWCTAARTKWATLDMFLDASWQIVLRITRNYPALGARIIRKIRR